MVWDDLKDVGVAFGAGAVNLPVDITYYGGMGLNKLASLIGNSPEQALRNQRKLDNFQRNPTPSDYINQKRFQAQQAYPNVFSAGEILGPGMLAKGLAMKLGNYIVNPRTVSTGKNAAIEFVAEPIGDRAFTQGP